MLRIDDPSLRKRYDLALRALELTALGDDIRKCALALDLAIGHCEKARAYSWPESEIRERGRQATASWESANAAARKLAVHFEGLDDLTSTARLSKACRRSGLRLSGKVAPHIAFPAMLRALAKQLPGKPTGGYVIGPLTVDKQSPKRPRREVVLTLALAYLFDRVAKHRGTSPLTICAGDAIESGSAWEAAACFTDAALGGDVNSVAAKKFLHDHRGHLRLRAWPRARQSVE